MISVVQLGTLAYAEGLRLQQKLVELRKSGQIGDVLLLLEHTPVITLGRNARPVNVLLPVEQLAARGVEVFNCDRGGDVTFHGPGQIVGYPIFDLRGFERQPSAATGQPSAVSSRLSAPGSQENQSATSAGSSPPWRRTLGAVDYVRRLEEVLIRTCGDFRIPTKRVSGLTGVWTKLSPDEHSREARDRGPQRARSSRAGVEDLSRANAGGGKHAALAAEDGNEAKIAAIGVHISRSVTSHGFALNVNTDLSYFSLIVPCGVAAKPVTSMEKELGCKLDVNEVAESLARNFGTVFAREIRRAETVDALLGRTVGVPMSAPEELRRLRGEDDWFLG